MCALLSCALAGMAQSDYPWKTLSKEENLDNQLYLLNVGTGLFANIGGQWGTEIVLKRTGIPFVITKKSPGLYFIHSAENYWGCRETRNASSIFVDNSIDSNDAMVLFDVQESTVRKNKDSYTIKVFDSNNESSNKSGKKSSFYLSAITENGETKLKLISADRKKELNDSSKWKLVDISKLKMYLQSPYRKDESDELENIDADYVYEADASFLVEDPNFSIGNSQDGGMNPYWSGIGYKTGAESQGELKDVSKYWHGFITGENAKTGKVTQTISSDMKGWYKLTCDGFFSNKSGKGKAYLIAGGNKKELCMVSADELSRLNIGKALYDGAYTNDLFVFLGKGESTEIGIEVEDISAEDLVTFDNFQLSYFGTKMFLFNEKVGKEKNNNESETGEGRKQPLLLKKSFDIGKWNSFCLPVNLTKKQFYDTFGKDARLAYLAKFEVTPERKFIQFLFKESDDLNDNDIFLEKNTGYLIKVFKEGMLEQDDETTQQMWLIKDAEWTENDTPIMSEETFNSENLNANINPAIQFKGTYYNHSEGDKPIPGESYELKTDANGYAFYHYTKPHNVEGFRCWIEDHSNSKAKLSIGFYSDDSTTGISEVNAVNTVDDNKTYNLAGQQVGNNYKGIVISNGKKYVKK